MSKLLGELVTRCEKELTLGTYHMIPPMIFDKTEIKLIVRALKVLQVEILKESGS